MSELNYLAGVVSLAVGGPVGHANATYQRYCAMAVLKVIETSIALVGVEDSGSDQ